MKLTPSTSSAAKLITLSMAILAVLTVISTPAAHAAPVTNNPPAMNGIQVADPEAPRAPVGPHGPYILRRGTSITGGSVKGTTRLGKSHPATVEEPEPSDGVELSMSPGHAKKRFVPEEGGKTHTSPGVAKRNDNEETWEEMWEQMSKAWWMQKRDEATLPAERKNEWWWGPKAKRSVPAGEEKDAAAVNKRSSDEEEKELILKRADADAVAERKNEWWWGPKAKRSVPAGEEKDAAAVNKRSSDEEQELGWWGWNGKRETDDARGFEVKELAKTHNKSKSKDATKKERGEGGEENRWNFKREIHQGDAKEHSGWVDSVVVRSGIPERPLKSEQKKRKREIAKRYVDDWSDASATAGSRKKDVGGLNLKKRKFRGWHFKREEERGEAGVETEVEAEAKVERVEDEGTIEFEKRRWHL